MAYFVNINSMQRAASSRQHTVSRSSSSSGQSSIRVFFTLASNGRRVPPTASIDSEASSFSSSSQSDGYFIP